MVGLPLYNCHLDGRRSVNSASNAGTNFRNVNNDGNVNNNNNASNANGGVAPGSYNDQGTLTASNSYSERRFEIVEGEGALSALSAKQTSAASDLTTSALMQCQRRCARNLRWKRPVQEMLLRPITKATKLRHSIEQRAYVPQKLEQVPVNERGKKRLVRPQTMPDRTVQTWLTQNFLTPLALKRMIPDSYACIKGRGLDYALDRVEAMLARAPMDAWVGQFDFKSYFASIEHRLLIEMLLSQSPNPLTDYLIKTIFSNNVVEENGVGLELGACTSQIGATMFPDAVDRAALTSPGCIGYGRYMDDGLVVATSKSAVVCAMDRIRAAAAKLHLTINEKKTHYNRITHPIVFCKHRFIKTERGVERTVRSEQIRYMRHHVKNIRRRSTRMKKPIDMTPVLASYFGYLSRSTENLLYLLDDIK